MRRRRLSQRQPAPYRARTTTRTTSALAVGIAAGCLLLLGAGQARAAEPRKPTPEKLWKTFPLEPQKKSSKPPKAGPTAPRPPAPPTTPAPVPRADGGTSTWVPVGLGAGALVLLAGVGVALVRRRATPQPVPESPAELIARAFALAQEAEECDKFVHRQREERARGMTETADQEHPDAATAPPTDKSSSYADIGERVAGVLAAAETAALQIREDARLNAEETIATARRDADQLRREAEAYDTDTRGAVDSYASDRRREAEQGVAKQLADSEAQARATRQAAEAMARQIEEAGRQRGHALREESKAVEERLKKALTGLRRMTAELEELLGPADGESLTDALKPYAQRDAQPAAAAKVETPA